VSRSHVRVRPAEQTDVAALTSLLDADPPPAPLGARAPLDHVDVAGAVASGDCVVLVAIDEPPGRVGVSGDVVGFVVAIDDEVGVMIRTPALHVSHLVVARKFRRRGVGRALLTAIVHIAEHRGVEQILASAVTTSRDANRYLARLGFAPYVVRRVASTAVLRRSLGIAEGSERVALIRRVRAAGVSRGARAASELRAARRGA
jgi:ribosomal protein S18 acetylase RimI-like enzyme